MKGICLCSGGLDSSLALIKLLEAGHQVVPMFADYNQWPVEEERQSFKYLGEHIWTRLALRDRLLDFVEVKIALDWDGFNEAKFIGDKVGSVWGRGIALTGIAAMWAYTHGDDFDFIALGNHEGDVGPDCKPGEFDETLDILLRQSTKNKMHIELPVRALTVEQIGIELNERGIDFGKMYSCYWTPHCGYRSTNDKYECPGCRRKRSAMKAAGIVDIDMPNGEKRSYQSSLATKLGY